MRSDVTLDGPNRNRPRAPTSTWLEEDENRSGLLVAVALDTARDGVRRFGGDARDNTHEIARAVTGTLLGSEVERVSLCLRAGDGVEFAFLAVGRGTAGERF